jgi:hypothetical protein
MVVVFLAPVGVACLNVGGQVTNQIRLYINSVQIPDKGFLSSANSGMTESVLFFSPVLGVACLNVGGPGH